MEIQILDHTGKAIEVKFPVYKKFGNSLYRLESPRKFTGVQSEILPHLLANAIECKTGLESTVAMILQEGIDITKGEFNRARNTALSYILRDDFIESTEPATEEEKREKIESNVYA